MFSLNEKASGAWRYLGLVAANAFFLVASKRSLIFYPSDRGCSCQPWEIFFYTPLEKLGYTFFGDKVSTEYKNSLQAPGVSFLSFQQSVIWPLKCSGVKNLPANAGDAGSIPGSRRSPGEGNGNPLQYSCLRLEELGGLQSTGSQRVEHAWARSSLQHQHRKPTLCIILVPQKGIELSVNKPSNFLWHCVRNLLEIFNRSIH